MCYADSCYAIFLFTVPAGCIVSAVLHSMLVCCAFSSQHNHDLAIKWQILKRVQFFKLIFSPVNFKVSLGMHLIFYFSVPLLGLKKNYFFSKFIIRKSSDWCIFAPCHIISISHCGFPTTPVPLFKSTQTKKNLGLGNQPTSGDSHK